MQCLIIAAGQGTRLRSIAPSKPLVRLAGRPLIEHIVRRARAGGASSFVVVTGYEAEGLEAFLAGFAGSEGIALECVRNPEWDKPNGHSVLAAGPRLDGDFLLLMSDHLFDPEMVRALVQADPEGELLLAVDYGIDSPLIDMDDATKVDVGEGGRIRRLGKTLERYNAVDTGLFRAGPTLLDALARGIAAGGQGSLSEGVQLLADEGRALGVDSGGRWWLDVDDPRAFALAEEALARPGGAA